MKSDAQVEMDCIDGLAALRRDGGRAPDLDALCRTAARLFDVHSAAATIIDETTVWIVGRSGAGPASRPRVTTVCNFTVQLGVDDALVVHDLAEDARFADNAMVLGEPYLRFYAGVAVVLSDGTNVGTLCVTDHVPRPDFGDREIAELHDLARSVEAHLDVRQARSSAETKEKERHIAQALLDRREEALEAADRRMREDERAARASERRFRLLAENTTDIVIWSDLDTTSRYVSPAAKPVLGYEPDDLVGTRPLQFVHPEDAEGYAGLLDDLCQGRIENALTVQRYRRHDRTYAWMEVSLSLSRDEASGPVIGYVASMRDVSDRKRMEEDLRLSEERLAMALDSGSDGLWDLDLATGALRLAGPWLSIMGFEEGEVPAHISAWEPRTHPDDRPRVLPLLVDHLKGLTPKYECEYRIQTKSGDHVWTQARGKVVSRDGNGRALRIVGTHTDITKRKAAEEEIAHMALHDSLTGLANRVLFHDRLNQVIAQLDPANGCFAVLACDLDRFKLINDTMGHAAGDATLRVIADRLRLIVREGDSVARLGGDEFAVILHAIETPQIASLIAARIIEAIGEPLEIDGRTVSVGISIGVAVCDAQETAADDLVRYADLALYRAKAEGRNAYRCFEPEMDAWFAERNVLEHDLGEALKRGGLTLHYQPVLSLESNDVCGFEALMRWRHPTRGLLSPNVFIPLAEESGLIVPLGEWALAEACRQAALWPGRLRMAVNVSAIQFRQPSKLQQSVVAALAASGLEPGRLELEVTESVLIQDADAVISCLKGLRELGVRIALDDFGTGYSSLAYLRRFPFDKIKIDRSFVREIIDPDTAAIVAAVVGLAVRVGADVTAEGVETTDQRSQVRAAGCTQLQGFLFSKPLEAEEASMIAGGRESRSAA